MSGFCKTHIVERTDSELTMKLANDRQLLKIYGGESKLRLSTSGRIARLEEEINRRKATSLPQGYAQINESPNPE